MAENILIASILIVVAFLSYLFTKKDATTDNQKLILIISFIIAVLSAILTGIFGYNKDVSVGKNEEYVRRIDTLTRRIDTLSTNHSDTLRINLGLANEALDSASKLLHQQTILMDSFSSVLYKQDELKQAQNIIAKFQQEKINQVIGGEIPPFIEITTEFPDFFYNGYIITRDRDSIGLKIVLKNNNKYYLRNIYAKLDHLDYNLIDRESYNNGIPLNSSYTIFDQNTIDRIPPKQKEIIFHTKIPMGYSSYMYFLKMKWETGSLNCDFNLIRPTLESSFQKNGAVLLLKDITFFDGIYKKIRGKYSYKSINNNEDSSKVLLLYDTKQ